jgi:hypothetical protein
VANKLDNLMPVEELNSRRTREQHSADSRKAGIASGKARQEKATMKRTLEMLLDEKNKKSGKTYRELATLGLIEGAAKGKSDNYRLILEIMGELGEKDNSNNNGILENLLGALNKAKEDKQ